MYTPTDFTHLLGTPGFSDEMLSNHFTLYQGYVKNANTLLDLQSELIKADKGASPEFAETKRRLGWEINGMRLHEYYFGNMTKEYAELAMSSSLANKIAQEFGSFEHWQREFQAVGAMRGIGWAVLVHDTASDRLLNLWVNEHDTGHIAGAKPLLVLDVFEHAFMMDYGIKRADYIKAFMQAVDWKAVQSRMAAV